MGDVMCTDELIKGAAAAVFLISAAQKRNSLHCSFISEYGMTSSDYVTVEGTAQSLNW